MKIASSLAYSLTNYEKTRHDYKSKLHMRVAEHMRGSALRIRHAKYVLIYAYVLFATSNLTLFNYG